MFSLLACPTIGKYFLIVSDLFCLYETLRCFIPECDELYLPAYHQEWLSWAIPNDSSVTSSEYVPSHCEKFIPNPTSDNRTCKPSAFSTNITICNVWVFSDERTIVNDVSQLKYYNETILTHNILTVEDNLLGKPMDVILSRNQPFRRHHRRFSHFWSTSRQVLFAFSQTRFYITLFL